MAEGDQLPQAIEYKSDEQALNPRVSLDALGPVIVNSDGTISRITNWLDMSKAEQESTMRVVARRNAKRLEELKKAENLI